MARRVHPAPCKSRHAQRAQRAGRTTVPASSAAPRGVAKAPDLFRLVCDRSQVHCGPEHTYDASWVSDRDLHVALLVDSAPFESFVTLDEAASHGVISATRVLLEPSEVEVKNCAVEAP